MTEHPAVQHEDSDINVRAVVVFAIGLVVVAVAIHLVVWLLFVYFAGRGADAPRLYPLAETAGQQLPPEPRLQTNPREDLRELRVREDQELNGYRWVDKNAGVVRIPIAEAMRLTIERGLPARAKKDGQP